MAVKLASATASFRIMAVVLVFALSWAVPVTGSAELKFLYKNEGAPVLEHGYDDLDLTQSRARKVVEFYQPLCGTCQSFKAAYVAAAKMVQSEDSRGDVEFYGVSCVANRDFCRQHGVKRFPTVLVFGSGSHDANEGIDVPHNMKVHDFVRRVEKLLDRGAPEATGVAESPSLVEVEGRQLDGSSEAESSDPDPDDEAEFEDPDPDDEAESEEASKRVDESVSGDKSVDVDEGDDDVEDAAVIREREEKKEDESEYQKKFTEANQSKESPQATTTKMREQKSAVEQSNKQETKASESAGPDGTAKMGGDPGDRKARTSKKTLKPFHETDAYKNTLADKTAGKDFAQWHEEKESRRKEMESNKQKISMKQSSAFEQHPQPIKEVVTMQRESLKPKKPRFELPVGGDETVPNPFENDPERSKRFEEYVAKRREKYLRKQKLKHPIKSVFGKSKEDLEIASHKRKESQTKKDKAPFKPKPPGIYQSSKKKPDLRPEAQKKNIGEKVLSKVPIVKRAFKKSKEEETLNDAALSFSRGLLMGVFKTQDRLDYKKKNALIDWLDLLSVSLPPEIGLHELIDDLRNNIDDVSESSKNLSRITAKHSIPNPAWSDSCSHGNPRSGFFCGFWKLLHVMSLGFSEQAGGLFPLQETNPSIRVFSAKEAGDVLREYMVHFFNCDKCSKRFISQYDHCAFNRCARLSDETIGTSVKSLREFPLWIWEMHNDISRSKTIRVSGALSEMGKKAEAKMWDSDMRAVYPHIDQCVTCITAAGSWDKKAVYSYLETEYWAFGVEENYKVHDFLKLKDIDSRDLSSGLGAYSVGAAMILILAWAAKKMKIAQSGRHKKVDSSFGFPRDSGTSKYRDS